MGDLKDWPICGRIIGKATGWDQPDTWQIQLYGFVPASNYSGPIEEVICIDFERGEIEGYDEAGNITKKADLIDSISGCEVSRVVS